MPEAATRPESQSEDSILRLQSDEMCVLSMVKIMFTGRECT
ncbi:MAG: hypothetical protein ACLRP8_08375 [Roseburia intestinalis]